MKRRTTGIEILLVEVLFVFFFVSSQRMAEAEVPKDDQKIKDALAEKALGNEAYKKKEFEKAIEHYDKAMELNPDEMSFLTNRSAVKFEINDLDGAIADCEEVIKQNKERGLHTDFKIIARAYARIGNAFAKKAELSNAIEAYEKSLLEAHDDKVYTNLRETKKRKMEAEERAYVDPEKSQDERKAGNEFFKSGKYPEAIQRYTEAIRRNPEDPAPYSNRAAAYMKLGEFPFALKDCEKCLQLDPKYTKAYSRKGSIHFFMKEYHKSLEAYKTAMEMDPGNPDLRMDYQRVMATVQQTANSDEVDEEQVKKAMADPEIQKILADPGVTQVLKEMSEKPEYAQKALEDPVMADKIKKLIAAGVVRVASR